MGSLNLHLNLLSSPPLARDSHWHLCQTGFSVHADNIIFQKGIFGLFRKFDWPIYFACCCVNAIDQRLVCRWIICFPPTFVCGLIVNDCTTLQCCICTHKEPKIYSFVKPDQIRSTRPDQWIFFAYKKSNKLIIQNRQRELCSINIIAKTKQKIQ